MRERGRNRIWKRISSNKHYYSILHNLHSFRLFGLVFRYNMSCSYYRRCFDHFNLRFLHNCNRFRRFGIDFRHHLSCSYDIGSYDCNYFDYYNH
jgi:hypothetical protein